MSGGPYNINDLATDLLETTGQNVGPGSNVFKQKQGTNLQFKTLVAGSNVTLSEDEDTITVSSSGGSGGGVTVHNDLTGRSDSDAHPINSITGLTAALDSKVDSGVSLGSGSPVFSSKFGSALRFRSLIAGAGVSLSGDFNSITISSVGDGQFLSVKDFGAVGNGTTDDTAAFQSAFNQSNTRAIFIPAGRYRINSNLTASTRLVLLGESRSHTVLEFFGDSRIIFTPNTQDTVDTRGQLILKDIQFLTRSSAQVSAFECAWTAGAGGTSYTVTAEDLDFVGHNSQTGWKWAFDLTDARNTSFRNVRVMGDRGVTSANGGIKAEGGFRFRGSNSGVEHKLFHCQVYFVKDAFSVQDTTEGVYITNCAAIKCLNGIVANSNQIGAMEPLVVVKGFHANVHQYGLWLRNYVQSFVSDCLIYVQADYDSLTPTVQCGIRVDNDSPVVKSDITIHDNVIFRLAGLWDALPDRYAVWLKTGDNILAHHNIIRQFTNGFVLGEDLRNFQLENNTYEGVQFRIIVENSAVSAKLKATPVCMNVLINLPSSGTGGRIDIPLPEGTLYSKAGTVIITPASNPFNTTFQYGFDDIQSTKNNLSIRVYRPTSFSGEPVRLNIMASEQM